MGAAYAFDWQNGPDGALVQVQLTVGMRTARDLRSMLMNAVYWLQENSPAGGREECLCLLFKTAFSNKRLDLELERFRSVVRDDLHHRVHVYALESPSDLIRILSFTDFRPWLEDLQARVAAELAGKPRHSSRETVVGTLLQRWIGYRDAVSITELAALAGASLPTAYAALDRLEPKSLHRDDERRVQLRSFSADAWQQWLTLSTDGIKVKFIDRSKTPRSPAKLARELFKLKREDLAVSGVLGALHHFPQLDITAAPHLDLVLHGPAHADLSFIKQLDPALVRAESPDDHAHVVVRFATRPESQFVVDGEGVWAGVLDCLVAMWDDRLVPQVQQLIEHVAPGGLHETPENIHG